MRDDPGPVVHFGGNLASGHPVEAFSKLLLVEVLFRGGREHDGARPLMEGAVCVDPSHLRGVHFQLIGVNGVGKDRPGGQQFVNVVEFLESVAFAESSIDFHFADGDDFAVGGCPCVEVLGPVCLQKIRAEKAGHHPGFSDGVGERGSGGSYQASAPGPQVVELHHHVFSAGRRLSGRVVDAGGETEVLEIVELVHQESVDPGLFEGDPQVFFLFKLPKSVFEGEDLTLDPLDCEPVGSADGVAQR